MDVTLMLLTKCDAIFMLNGWENSRGAQIELSLAQKNNLKILTVSDLN